MADEIQKLLDPFLKAADSILGAQYSCVLYGSAARGDFVPGASNVNLLLILDEVSYATLRALGPAFAAWSRNAQEPPLLMSRREWSEAADAFPIEIAVMQSSYRVLRGDDPLAGVTVARSDLRRAVEREFRGKLLRLRQAYAGLSADEKALSAVAADSASTMVLLYRALLLVLGQEIPVGATAVAAAGAAAAGFPAEAVSTVVMGRGNRGWRATTAQFEAYVDAVSKTAEFVDHLQIGDQ